MVISPDRQNWPANRNQEKLNAGNQIKTVRLLTKDGQSVTKELTELNVIAPNRPARLLNSEGPSRLRTASVNPKELLAET